MRSAVDLGQRDVVKAITSDRSGGRADDLAPIFVSPEIGEKVHAGVLDGSISFAGAAAALRAVRRSGEPWTFGMRPDMVPNYLNRRGLRLLADLGADEYRRKVIGPTARPIGGSACYHAALAELGG